MSTSTKDWFSVDKEGLAKILERRGKVFALYELISNAWDTNATEVKVTAVQLSPQRVFLTIEDDDPEGFKNLTHAYTLFAESDKKGSATKRGRFNLGEKLVLAVCESADIMTTTGCVFFDKDGRKTSRAHREKGSIFTGKLRMKRAELDEALENLKLLIEPGHVETTVNGEKLPQRKCLKRIPATLPTEIADEEGNLRKSSRKTFVDLYEPLPGEVAMIYEMGVPVVETGDKWHANVLQKVPLNMDRDNVTPAYLREVRTLVLNTMAVAGEITPAMATETWVREAAADSRASFVAIKVALDARFGEKRVAYDMSDPEANKRAVAAGYTVVHGGSLSAGEWENAKRYEAILPAGKVTPSPKPYSKDGDALKMLAPDEYTRSIRDVVFYAKKLAASLLEVDLSVDVANDPEWGFNAVWSRGRNHLRFNLGALGHAFFSDIEAVDQLLLHEFSHAKCSDHLAIEFAEEGFRLGAKLKHLALKNPEFFDLFK